MTCIYSIRFSSGCSLFAKTLEVGKASGPTLNRTLRRELVMTREAIETELLSASTSDH